MQGPGGGRNPFFDFGDPFGGFGSFGPPGSLISSFLGGRNPFDDPFFTQPFGGMFESIPFGGPTGFPFAPVMHPSGFLEHQAPGMHPSMFHEHQVPGMNPPGFLGHQAPVMGRSRFIEQAPDSSRQRGPIIQEVDSEQPSRRRGPIIQELDSDNENEDTSKEKKENPRKHSRSNDEPSVEHPDDEIEGKKSRYLQAGDDNRFNTTGLQPQPQPQPQPQSRSFCFQSSTVSYGGPNGMYYTSSRTRRSGSDGVTFEESKEADSSTMRASHRISRGIHGKGHSLSRKLNSDGRVDTMQTLHNINEDEFAGFEEEWKAKGQRYLPGWTGSFEARGNNGQIEQARQGGWALPSSELGTISEAREEAGSSRSHERLRAGSNGRSAYPPGGESGQH